MPLFCHVNHQINGSAGGHNHAKFFIKGHCPPVGMFLAYLQKLVLDGAYFGICGTFLESSLNVFSRNVFWCYKWSEKI